MRSLRGAAGRNRVLLVQRLGRLWRARVRIPRVLGEPQPPTGRVRAAQGGDGAARPRVGALADRVTPAARIAAAVELLAAIADAAERPADAVANEWFRARRFIGAGDRRVVAERVWQIVRARRRLEWWLRGTLPTPRLLVAAALLLEGGSLARV